MIKLFVFLIFTFSACSPASPGPIDPALQPYVDQLQPYADKVSAQFNTDALSFSIAPLPHLAVGQEAGECDINSVDDGNEITVDKTLWTSWNADQKAVLIFHELGHCLLGRVHLNTYDQANRRFVSLMNQSTIPYEDFVRYKDYYLTELVSIDQTEKVIPTP